MSIMMRMFTKMGKMRRWYLFFMLTLFAGAFLWLPALGQSPENAAPGAAVVEHVSFKPFQPLLDTARYNVMERTSLLVILLIALAGLGYALMLVGQVMRADRGTPKMQEIANAVREGANAYMAAQFRKIGPLIIIITILLFIANTSSESAFRWGRSVAFLVGALFSWTVGFVGMRLATAGNLRVAAAATRSYGEAMQIGYRTGTITGMLTDGLGLLGGTLIFLIFGEKAYEALLGFGFGGTLLALFMRVGGGIYTKAADVG
ncbi:MAG: sodium/proton-translocating pyrophosphatase, partial [bacterium]